MTKLGKWIASSIRCKLSRLQTVIIFMASTTFATRFQGCSHSISVHSFTEHGWKAKSWLIHIQREVHVTNFKIIRELIVTIETLDWSLLNLVFEEQHIEWHCPTWWRQGCSWLAMLVIELLISTDTFFFTGPLPSFMEGKTPNHLSFAQSSRALQYIHLFQVQWRWRGHKNQRKSAKIQSNRVMNAECWQTVDRKRGEVIKRIELAK